MSIRPGAPTREEATRLLSAAPGPSPWFLNVDTPILDSRWGRLAWAHQHSVSVLRDPEGSARLILGSGVFTLCLSPRTLLVWYGPQRLTTDGDSVSGRVHFRMIDTDDLEVVKDVDFASRILNKHSLRLILFSASNQSQEPDLSIPIAAEGGAMSMGIRREFDTITELLFFVNYRVDHVTLWSLRPGVRMLEMWPQDWFNSGNYDYGYEWPTRAARDPVTGSIVGEGFRLPTFLLDASGRNVAAWLR